MIKNYDIISYKKNMFEEKCVQTHILLSVPFNIDFLNQTRIRPPSIVPSLNTESIVSEVIAL